MSGAADDEVIGGASFMMVSNCIYRSLQYCRLAGVEKLLRSCLITSRKCSDDGDLTSCVARMLSYYLPRLQPICAVLALNMSK